MFFVLIYKEHINFNFYLFLFYFFAVVPQDFHLGLN